MQGEKSCLYIEAILVLLEVSCLRIICLMIIFIQHLSFGVANDIRLKFNILCFESQCLIETKLVTDPYV